MWQNCTQATFKTPNRKSVGGNKHTCTADPLAVAALCKSGQVESQFVPNDGMKTPRNTGGAAPRICDLGIAWS